MLDALRRAASQKADIAVFPELVLLGYPPKDLLLKSRLIEENVKAVHRVAAACHGITAVVGFAEPTGRTTGRPLYNAAAICRDGDVIGRYHKCLLPTYDVFDEDRYFEPGDRCDVLNLADAFGRECPVGISICEDLWNQEHIVTHRRYPRNPAADLARAGAKIILNLSASPYSVGKDDYRRELFFAHAARHSIPIACVNQVGGNDDLIFDGASAVYLPQNRMTARAKAFEEDLLLAEIGNNAPASRIEDYPERLASIYAALVLGTRDYVRKCGFKGVVLGLSGGIDSALTAVIAVDALGKEAVHGVAMPSRFSSDHSVNDARLLAENLGIDFRTLTIESTHAAVESTLAPAFAGREPDSTEENVQARIRGNLLMALSNKFGWLLLTTGNKSELAVGYCTLYGDMCGGLAVISDVPKTTIYELARLVNQRANRALIPQSSIDKAPSAELRPNQTDQDSLPPYDLLDAILKRYVEDLQSADEIIAAGYEPGVVREVARKVDLNEYKRKQAALGLKVTSRAFGSGRRMPIAARFKP